jgi:hypothetical protein
MIYITYIIHSKSRNVKCPYGLFAALWTFLLQLSFTAELYGFFFASKSITMHFCYLPVVSYTKDLPMYSASHLKQQRPPKIGHPMLKKKVRSKLIA